MLVYTQHVRYGQVLGTWSDPPDDLLVGMLGGWANITKKHKFFRDGIMGALTKPLGCGSSPNPALLNPL